MPDHQAAPPEAASAPARRPRLRQRLRTPQEARQWRRRVAGYALVGVSFVLVVNALVGENGYLATARARREQADVMEQVRELQRENHRIKEEIRRLKEDPAALEEAARRHLRLSKPGETMVVITEPSKPKTPPASR